MLPEKFGGGRGYLKMIPGRSSYLGDGLLAGGLY